MTREGGGDSVTDAPRAMATCPACAHLTAEGQRFCPSCGTPLATDGLPTDTAPRSLSRAGRRGSPSPRPSAPRPSPAGSGSATPAPGPAPRFVPGALFGERYRIVGLLGRGGMGEVYRADDLRLGQAVALKFLPESLNEDAGRRERFYNEVRMARQIAHPAVCRVYDIGEEEGQPFLTMEYVDGEDLASLLRRIGRLPADKAVDIARQLCAGLAAAHDKGVLHRDLKPDNVMLDGRGKVRITDFGLAGLAETIQREDVRSGTPAYMSPEQLAGREVTVASDVYALGLVLYELFTGRKPFEGRTLAELMRKHEETTPADPSSLVQEIDPAVERVILRCLEKDPRLRPSSALAVAAALPGGDPLAAALAAGELPSPEMVAAAGAEALRARTARALLVVALVALALVPPMARHIQITGMVPLDKPPDALEDRARDALRALGQDGAPADHAKGFNVDQDYLGWVESRDRSPERWERLRTGGPATLRYWYRQSPRSMSSTMMSGRVRWTNPPALVSGMAGVELDMEGRLVGFYRVTPQVEAGGAAVAAPDWSTLFTQAGLDPTQFAPAVPQWTPPFYTDARTAWTRRDAARTDLPSRVEAAAYRGRPVYLQLVGDWTRPERMVPFPFTAGQMAAARVGIVLLLALTVGALRLARQNLRLGRGDRRGASRVAGLTAVLVLAQWAATAHHVPDMFDELAIAARGISFTLLVTCSIWILYLALEPYVRRQWPETLVSWTRLLAGRYRDPMVARDLLVGGAIGCAFSVILPFAWAYLLPLTGIAPPRPVSDDDGLLGGRYAVAAILSAVVVGLGQGLGLTLLRVPLRRLLRYEWAVAAAFAVVVSLEDALALGGPFWMMLPFVVAVDGLPLYLIVRCGVLPSVVALFMTSMLLSFPAGPNLGHWSASPMLAGLTVAAAIVVYGFRVSGAGEARAVPAS